MFAVNSFGCVYTNDGYTILQCNQPYTVHVVNATIGISSKQCRDGNKCCPSPTDVNAEESSNDMQELRQRCDGWNKCEVVIFKKNISGEITDYESVNYMCRRSGKLLLHV